MVKMSRPFNITGVHLPPPPRDYRFYARLALSSSFNAPWGVSSRRPRKRRPLSSNCPHQHLKPSEVSASRLLVLSFYPTTTTEGKLTCPHGRCIPQIYAPMWIHVSVAVRRPPSISSSLVRLATPIYHYLHHHIFPSSLSYGSSDGA